MAGQPSNSRSAIEETIRDEVQKLFVWRPPEFTIAPRPSGKKGSTGSRAPGMFDKHFSERSRLKRIVIRPDLFHVLETLAEDTFNNSLPKLPAIDELFQGGTARRLVESVLPDDMLGERAIVTHHLRTTATFCVQLAAMLALHPRSPYWCSLAYWTDSAEGPVAIADLIMLFYRRERIPNALLDTLDDDVRAFFDDWQLKALNRVEIKSLTVGPLEVMEALGSPGPFVWTSCKCMVHPDILSRYNVQIYEIHAHHKKSSDVARKPETSHDGTLPLFTYLEPGASLPQNKKRKTHTSPTRHPSKRQKQSTPAKDSSSDSGSGLEDNGSKHVANLSPKTPPKHCSILQQEYAQLVRHDLTFLVLHSGNYQRIAYRRRYPEGTLYISPLIQPHAYPTYGKAHVGFDIASFQDAMSRWKLNNLSKYSSDNDDRGRSLGSRGGNGDCDESEPKGCGGGGDEPQDNFEGGENGAGGGESLKEGSLVVRDGVIAGERLKSIALLAHRRMMLVSLKYGVYDSPRPVPFLHMECPSHTRSCELPYTLEDTFGVVMTSEIGAGATGVVLRGTLFVEGSEDITPLDVAMKISIGNGEKAALAHEHDTYRFLNAHAITRGIGTVLGFFRDACEPGDHALLMLYDGVVFDQACTGSLSPAKRAAALETLANIHAAGFLHGDIRPENILVGEQGLTLIDFAYATRTNDHDDMRNEHEELSRIIDVGTL